MYSREDFAQIMSDNISEFLKNLQEPEEIISELDNAIDVSSVAGDPCWDADLVAMLKSSVALFASEILTGPNKPPYNGHYLIGDHHLEWDDLIAKYKKLCLLASRYSGKSYFFSFALPLWKASFGMPGDYGIIFTSTAPLAVELLAIIRAEVESNPKLQFLNPKNKLAWSATKLQLANGYRLYAKGFGSRVRGRHPAWAVVDDCLTDETIYSPMVRDKQTNYFLTAISGMMGPDDPTYVVGTPFHELDMYSKLKNNKQFYYKKYAIINKDGTALWPALWPLKKIAAKREELANEILFSREYMCEPISDAAAIFPLKLFQGQDVEQYQLKLGCDKKFYNELGLDIFIGVDFAISSEIKADWTCIFVLGVDSKRNRWIIDIIRAQGKSYQEQLSMIVDVARKYDPGLILLEANQMQRIWGDELIKNTDLPIRKFLTTSAKNDFEKGVTSLRPLLENKKIRIPRGDARSVEITDQWISEMTSFTIVDGKLTGVGAHDDTVMAFWIADQGIRMGSFSASFGDELTYTAIADPTKKKEEETEDVTDYDSEEVHFTADFCGGEGTGADSDIPTKSYTDDFL